jgi:hypothetical protein
VLARSSRSNKVSSIKLVSLPPPHCQDNSCLCNNNFWTAMVDHALQTHTLRAPGANVRSATTHCASSQPGTVAVACQRTAAVATSAYSGVTVAPTVVFAVRCLPMCGVNRSTNRVRGLPMCGVYRSTNRRLRSVATLGALLQVLCRLPVACAAVLLPPLLTHARALDVPCGELALGVMRPRTLL